MNPQTDAEKRYEFAVLAAITMLEKAMDTGWSIYADDALTELKKAVSDLGRKNLLASPSETA